MDMDIDDEYEEEEYLLYVDVDPTSLTEEQVRDSLDIKTFGLDTNKPLLQINNQFYEGEFEPSMGTHVFFEQDDKQADKLYCKCEKYYKFSAKTTKVLKMTRVLIKDKAAENVEEKDVSGIKGQLSIQHTYQQALNLFLCNRKPPREIPEKFNCTHLLPAATSSIEETKEESETQ